MLTFKRKEISHYNAPMTYPAKGEIANTKREFADRLFLYGIQTGTRAKAAGA
ncbi:hypothetical protein [Jeotgalibacillus malaysiensis]|uniref:hypothetical protein n=1 Tax=Jeotgalibacillus malaysiensis TaxID=1508404 RepID=UPI00384C235D